MFSLNYLPCAQYQPRINTCSSPSHCLVMDWKGGIFISILVKFFFGNGLSAEYWPSAHPQNGGPLPRSRPPSPLPPRRPPRLQHVFPALVEPVCGLAAAGKLTHVGHIGSPDADEPHAKSHAIPPRRGTDDGHACSTNTP